MKATQQKTCDICNKQIKKAHRIYRNLRHCGSCYARYFKKRICSKCNTIARLPTDDESAICLKCQRNKPCVRCNKIDFKTGRMTVYGPVCKSCARYFNTPEPCGLCGDISRFLRRSKEDQNIKCCPKCARLNNGTCQLCHRYRPLLKSKEGKLICKTCFQYGYVNCRNCGESMPAGRGHRCENCYWADTFIKRLKIDRAAFSSVTVNTAFNEFGEWLHINKGAKKAALSIHRYLIFFKIMEDQWNRIPDYNELISYFGADGLRRVRLPMEWLKEAYGIFPDLKIKQVSSESRQIEKLMDSIPKNSHAELLLTGYRDMLFTRAESGKISLRSIRLALRSAVSFMATADKNGSKLPDQKILNHFLRKTPGQIASITGFVNYLNKSSDLSLDLFIVKKQLKSIRKKWLESQLFSIYQLKPNDLTLKKWLPAALEYFHNISPCFKKPIDSIVYDEGGYMVFISGNLYYIPYPFN